MSEEEVPPVTVRVLDNGYVQIETPRIDGMDALRWEMPQITFRALAQQIKGTPSANHEQIRERVERELALEMSEKDREIARLRAQGNDARNLVERHFGVIEKLAGQIRYSEHYG